MCVMVFFVNDTATTEIYTLSLHDALPIWVHVLAAADDHVLDPPDDVQVALGVHDRQVAGVHPPRSEEHMSELQSRQYLVCRLLLEKKNSVYYPTSSPTYLSSPNCYLSCLS